MQYTKKPRPDTEAAVRFLCKDTGPWSILAFQPGKTENPLTKSFDDADKMKVFIEGFGDRDIFYEVGGEQHRLPHTVNWETGTIVPEPRSDFRFEPHRTNVAEEMMELFGGLKSAYGTHGEPEQEGGSSKWGIGKTARTIREPVAVELWQQHLDGERPLGIILIREDGMCRCVVGDVDVYRDDLSWILEKIEKLKLPLVPCYSKSGGLHLLLILKDWTPVKDARPCAEQLMRQLGLPATTEIFPKQTHIEVERGDVGNWILMPYFGSTYDGKLKRQVGVKWSGAGMTIYDFIAAAKERMTTLDELKLLGKKQERKKKTASAGGDMPKCLKEVLEAGVPDGQRNETLFNLGVYARNTHPESWKEVVTEWNVKHFNPSLSFDEVSAVIKSLDRKEYGYKMGCGGMCAESCGECHLGEKAGDYPVVLKLIKEMSDPPTWTVVLPEGQIDNLTASDVTTFKLFNQAAFKKLDVRFTTTRGIQARWDKTLNAALCEKVAPTPEMTDEAVFLEELEEFLTNRQRGDREEDILTGRPWEDMEEGQHWFRLKDLVKYLEGGTKLLTSTQCP
jgi:hypothetical protein